MRRAAALLVLVFVAGCVETAPSDEVPVDGVVPEAVALPDAGTAHLASSQQTSSAEEEAPAAVPVLSAGQMLRWEGECPCEPVPFDLNVAGEWDGWVEVRVQWDGAKVADLGLRLDGPYRSEQGERGFDDRLARIFDPVGGRHEIAIDGTGAYTATARLGSTAVPVEGALLPNLVELVIEGPRIGDCDEVERTEQGATKCMRFGNGVGNPGHGAVQIRLTVEQGAMALAALEGRFAQEIRQADGTLTSHVVGPAEFHVSHIHWHYDGLALFELFAVDQASGLRGDLASSHHKSGFCFLDWGEMEEPVTRPAEQERAESDCLIPGTGGSWTNGISRGWYDFYWSDLTDQYVDVAGLPDGVYELVASADPLGTLDELDETDNQSSVLIRLTGDGVEVLEERAHYRVQEKDDE